MKLNTSAIALLAAAHSALATIATGNAGGYDVAWIDGQDPCSWTYICNAGGTLRPCPSQPTSSSIPARPVILYWPTPAPSPRATLLPTFLADLLYSTGDPPTQSSSTSTTTQSSWFGRPGLFSSPPILQIC